MKTYKDIIEDTLKYYTTHNRGLFDVDNPSFGCLYITDKGDMCAVGRYAKDPQKLQDMDGDLSQICEMILNSNDDLDLEFSDSDYDGVMIDEVLNEDVSHLNSYYFWETLQQFHDNPNNWIKNDKGGWSLTEIGQQNYINLLETDWD